MAGNENQQLTCKIKENERGNFDWELRKGDRLLFASIAYQPSGFSSMKSAKEDLFDFCKLMDIETIRLKELQSIN